MYMINVIMLDIYGIACFTAQSNFAALPMAKSCVFSVVEEICSPVLEYNRR